MSTLKVSSFDAQFPSIFILLKTNKAENYIFRLFSQRWISQVDISLF